MRVGKVLFFFGNKHYTNFNCVFEQHLLCSAFRRALFHPSGANIANVAQNHVSLSFVM